MGGGGERGHERGSHFSLATFLCQKREISPHFVPKKKEANEAGLGFRVGFRVGRARWGNG